MLRLPSIKTFLSKAFHPYRIFIALMIAVAVWLFPFMTFTPQPEPLPIEHGVIEPAEPFTAGALGPCSDVRCDPGSCCVSGYCVVKSGCGGGEENLPPTISGSLSCSQWGNNGWCIDSLSLNLSASDPQGQSVIISGSIQGVTFACPSGATSCSVRISAEGSGTATYIVNSGTGLWVSGSLSHLLDFTTPSINGSLNGVGGANPWFVSDVTVSASASDAISGLASFEYSLDGGVTWTVFPGSLDLTDGVHTLDLRAYDRAGNLAETTQSILIDTITPSLNVSLVGTAGLSGWHTSVVQVTAVTSDAGSGIAKVEALVDGVWADYTAPLSFSDGHHSYRFKITDNAGNVTESPVQDLHVDTIAPAIGLPGSWALGKTVEYKVTDGGSGLQPVRVVIEDEDERYAKLFWDEYQTAGSLLGEIAWDGVFRDGVIASPGVYYATLKVTDVAGNEVWKTGRIVVAARAGSSLQFMPPLALPSAVPTAASLSSAPASPPVVPAPTASSFGGTSVRSLAESAQGTVRAFSKAPFSLPQNAIPASNILWGAAAAAAVGAFVAEAARRRQEEEGDGGPGTYAKAAKAYQAARNNFNATVKKAQAMGMSDTEAARLKENVSSSGKIGASLGAASGYIAKKEKEADTQAAWIEKQEAANAGILTEALATQKAAEEEEEARWLEKSVAEDHNPQVAATTDKLQGMSKTSPRNSLIVNNNAGTTETKTNWLQSAWNTVTTAVTGTLSPGKSTSGTKVLAAPALYEDKPKWWEKIKELVDSVKEKWEETKVEIGNDIKKVSQDTVLNAAELTYEHLYVPSAKFFQEHPKAFNIANAFVDPINLIASKVVNQDPQTASWSDLTAMWFFELGETPEMRFDAHSPTTKDLMMHEGATQQRVLVLQDLLKGDTSIPNPYLWDYDKPQFFAGVLSGDIMTSFLGSYTTEVTSITPNPDGSYTISYRVINQTSWGSGTRLRRPDYPGGPHKSIIPDKFRGEGVHFGGDFVQYWQWTETVTLPDLP